MKILDAYVKSAPHPQHALDIFANEWSSAMPAGCGLTTQPGAAGLFEDPRIAWADDRLGFTGRTVLELGPLEAGHTRMMQQRGARAITAIESNTRAFLKCLIIKELFRLDGVSFLLGDFNEYLALSPPRVDICVASGVLYHCVDPVATLAAITSITDRLFVWTHYYDEAIIRGNAALRPFFDAPETLMIGGKPFPSATKRYRSALDWSGFCGGNAEHARWLSRDAIFQCLAGSGMTSIEVAFDHPDHPNGPALAICAMR